MLRSDKYRKELVEDFETLSKTVGAAIDLSDRGWKSEVWCDDTYQEVIDDMYHKYVPFLPKEYQDFVPIKVDDYLEIEEQLMKFLKEAILEIMLQ